MKAETEKRSISSAARNWIRFCSLGFFLYLFEQEQDRQTVARPRLTLQDLSKNKTEPARLLSRSDFEQRFGRY